jgi:hypothetical protein
VGPTINETESNNTMASANAITTAGTTVNATMSASTDVDYYKVTIPAGKTLTVTMTPNATSDYDLELYNSSGTKIASSVKGTGQADTVTRASAAGEVVYAKVFYYGGGTGSTSGKYTLTANW